MEVQENLLLDRNHGRSVALLWEFGHQPDLFTYRMLIPSFGPTTVVYCNKQGVAKMRNPKRILSGRRNGSERKKI